VTGLSQYTLARVLANVREAPFILGLGAAGLAAYSALAFAGDLRARFPLYFVAHLLLTGVMLLAWHRIRGSGRGLGVALAAALLFRIVAALGEPALSDDVYRYVWDGRVQLHGFHPYAHAPADPELAGLRDESWRHINHPGLKTIYPPLAEIGFLVLSALGAGQVGFRIAIGLLDFGVVLALGLLLRRLGLPGDRVILYAWNPLAVMETAGSGHVEPLGITLVVLAAGWIMGRRPLASIAALAGAVHAKLLPILLVPGYLRRVDARGVALLVALLVLPALPYALTGPPIGAGLFTYAGTWEHNAFFYGALEGILSRLDLTESLKGGVARLQQGIGGDVVPWDLLYRAVWPRELARGMTFVALAGWVLFLAGRPRSRLGPARETYLVLAATVLLLPAVHPWYLLWVLPFAAVYLSPGWLLFAALVPLAYSNGGADIGWGIKCLEYLPPLALMAWSGRLTWSRRVAY